MLSLSRATWLVALLGVATVSAADCDSNLLIDNFESFGEGKNNVQKEVGDDGTMVFATSSTENGGYVSLVPQNKDSYFYENLNCTSVRADGYGAVSFSLQGPADGSVAVEIQSKTSCDEEEYTSSYSVVSGLKGEHQDVSLPLSSFEPAVNQDGVVAIVWSQFDGESQGTWTIGNVQLACGSSDPTPTSSGTPDAPSRTSATPSASGDCQNLLIDDWESQSRLTFLNYNAMKQSSSDDGSMQSIVVDNHHVMLTPKSTDSYFYTQLGCVDARNKYGGISFRIRASEGTSFIVRLSSLTQCGGQTGAETTVTTSDLGWEFDGTEKLYSFSFDQFSDFDISKLSMVYFSELTQPVIFGPMAFYCGSDPSEYRVTEVQASDTAITTVAAPSATASQLVVDGFRKVDSNSLNQWHGGDDGIVTTFSRDSMTIHTNDSDLAWNTQLAERCTDMRAWKDSYLHVAYTGSNKFSIALQQHNEACNNSIQPYPETWDSIEAARYATDTDIYVPISHFNVNLTRAIGFAFKGFYTTDPTTFTVAELVDSVPDGFEMPSKLPSGSLLFSCKRPNSFAFAIDDGEPRLAQQVVDIVKSENITVTFFTVGLPLLDPTTNLSNVYLDMQRRGHQIAMHSYTHPKMEGLPDLPSIDWEYNNDIGAVKQVFNGMHTPYFRPPFGTEGARMRQRLAVSMGVEDPNIVMWSVDVEDWLWAETDTPERQLAAFKRDLAKGGNLVVMHYLYDTTVGYLREFIQLAKGTGKRLMRVDQCMMDPNAPPLDDE